jgi:hypothetical protein
MLPLHIIFNTPESHVLFKQKNSIYCFCPSERCCSFTNIHQVLKDSAEVLRSQIRYLIQSLVIGYLSCPIP